jgi:hypothetical protein
VSNSAWSRRAARLCHHVFRRARLKRHVRQTAKQTRKRAIVDQHEEVLTAYLDHAEAVSLRHEERDLPPALDHVEDLIRRDPETAWTVIQELVRRATCDEVLAYIAAGPLENLLCNHPHAFIDRVEVLAARDAHFRRALSGVWGWSRMPDDVVARLDTLFGDEPRL